MDYMAARTSYFPPKSARKFFAWADRIPGCSVRKSSTSEDKFALIFNGYPVPEERFSDASHIDGVIHGFGDLVDFDYAKELAEHIQDGWAAAHMEVGSENMQMYGRMMIIRSDGKVRSMSLLEWLAEQVEEDLGAFEIGEPLD